MNGNDCNARVWVTYLVTDGVIEAPVDPVDPVDPDP